jgi:hypothetical protein
VLALLALGLNLIFGVIDVTWICYAELVMMGMYGMYYHGPYFGLPFLHRRPADDRCWSAALGALLHLLVIAPLLNGAPINQLLATGGVLFVSAELRHRAFGIDFRNLGIRLPVLEFAEMYISYARLLAFGCGAGRHGAGVSVPEAHLYRHRDPRHRAGSADHAADGRRYQAYLPHHLGDRRRRSPASHPACWCCNTTCIRSSACPSDRSPS